MVIEALLAAILAASGIAPGLKGYEGQPGNQGGNSAVNTGYEGQPGNQSNGNGNGQQGYEGQPGHQSNGGGH